MELPRLEKLWRRYRDRGLSIVAVEAMADSARATAFIAENGLTYHFLENDRENNDVRAMYGVQAFPTSLLVDRDGRILYYHVGFQAGDEDALEKEILDIMGG